MGTLDQHVELLAIVRVLWFGMWSTVRFEVVSVREGGLVDPVSGDGLGQHIEGRLILFGGDVRVVGVPASGHGGVDAATVGGCVDEEEAGVDGAALGGVAGLGVSQLEVVGGVLDGETHGAGASGDGDASIVVDAGDRPVVAVLDHKTLIGAEGPVVASGDDLVAD